MGEGYRQEKVSVETQGKLIHEISMEWKKKRQSRKRFPMRNQEGSAKEAGREPAERGDGKAAGAEEVEHFRKNHGAVSSDFHGL